MERLNWRMKPVTGGRLGILCLMVALPRSVHGFRCSTAERKLPSTGATKAAFVLKPEGHFAIQASGRLCLLLQKRIPGGNVVRYLSQLAGQFLWH